MNTRAYNKNLSIIFLSNHLFAFYYNNAKRYSGRKRFKVFQVEYSGENPGFSATLPPEVIKKLSDSNIVLVSDSDLLHHEKKNAGNITFSNRIIDELFHYLNRQGVKAPVIISSLASPEILFHFYAKNLKFFPDDRTYILSGDDDLIFEARLRGKGLAEARLLQFDNFDPANKEYERCDHLITFTADPYAFRFEEAMEQISNDNVLAANNENFTLEENSEDGKSYKGIYNLCEMVSALYFSMSLPVPGLLTKEEVEKSDKNLAIITSNTINRAAAAVFALVVLFTIISVMGLVSLSNSADELEAYKTSKKEIYQTVNEYGGKVLQIPGSREKLPVIESKFVRISALLKKIESYAVDKNIQITKITVEPNNYILIRGYAESPAVASGFVDKIKGAQLLSSEIFKTEAETFTAFRIMIPGEVK
ncbi:MAG: hypothetical protein LCH52_00570 [Bacteroidetes bacterium]|nr:hypothetical protein [Bacteroidota bacterium]